MREMLADAMTSGQQDARSPEAGSDVTVFRANFIRLFDYFTGVSRNYKYSDNITHIWSRREK